MTHSVLGPIFLSICAIVPVDAQPQAWADKVRALITEHTHPPEYYGGRFDITSDAGTSHMSIVDSDGNAAALTATVNHYFGAKVRSNSTGIIFNNQLDDFGIKGTVNDFGLLPSPANYIKGGKRPLSSMSPLIFYQKDTGAVKLALGASGGSRITTAVSQVAARILWTNETIKEAIDAARLHNQLYPDQTGYENDFPKNIRDILSKQYWHKLGEESPREISVVSGIHRINEHLYGNADYRKRGGYAAGY